MAGSHDAKNTLIAGAPLENAKAALILVHGRGATAESMLPLAEAFGVKDVAYVLPEATQNTWYPFPFMSPIDANEPWLSSALSLLAELIAQLGAQGIQPERIGLAGFSQGACLSTEFVARNARRYGLVAGLSGGLIGPEGTPRDYPGSLDGTPVFLGCSDIDAHIPVERVKETSMVLNVLGAKVDERIYRGMGHTVNDDEVKAVGAMLGALSRGTP
jgi:predicted esterase